MMKTSIAATAFSTMASATPAELSDQMLDMVSGGNNGIGQTMGPILHSTGGMAGMASMGMTPGADMGNMLHTDGGMKNAMNNMA